MITKYAEMCSLILTFLTLQMCIEVLVLWSSEAKKFLDGERAPWAWVGAAIFLHFLSSFVDNFYWGVAWSNAFIESKYTEFMFANGVFSNIPFRQIGVAASGFCYLRAGYLFQKKHMSGIYHRMFSSILIGIIYVLALKYI